METSSLEHQIQSVQRHIAFLKKEQMGLLHDLHLEILRLQKQCTELTHDLEMKELEANQQDLIDQELEKKCKIMAAHLQEKEETNLQWHSELRQRENLVAALRSSLRSKERKFLEELKRRSHRVTILNTELQKQTEAAAYLSYQLHATKHKLLSSRQGGNPGSERPSEKLSLFQPSAEVQPKKRTTKSHARRQVSSSYHSKGSSRDSSARERLNSFDETDPMPDPALFLYTKRHHAMPHRPKSEHKTPASANDTEANRRDSKAGRPKPACQTFRDGAESTSGAWTLEGTRASSNRETRGRSGSSPQTTKDPE